MRTMTVDSRVVRGPAPACSHAHTALPVPQTVPAAGSVLASTLPHPCPRAQSLPRPARWLGACVDGRGCALALLGTRSQDVVGSFLSASAHRFRVHVASAPMLALAHGAASTAASVGPGGGPGGGAGSKDAAADTVRRGPVDLTGAFPGLRPALPPPLPPCAPL